MLPKPNQMEGIYYIDKTTQQYSPIESHPVPYRDHSNNEIHVWLSYSPHMRPPKSEASIIIEDNFQEIADKTINIVSDASVHTDTGEASGAWHIFQDNQQQLKVIRPIKLGPFSHSYRAEIETAIYTLIHARKLPVFNPSPMTLYFDCESGVHKLQSEINSPKDVMAGEMDLVLAFKHIKARTTQDIQLRWVLGHADQKKKMTPPK